jgi:hypothetical protein
LEQVSSGLSIAEKVPPFLSARTPRNRERRETHQCLLKNQKGMFTPFLGVLNFSAFSAIKKSETFSASLFLKRPEKIS